LVLVGPVSARDSNTKTTALIYPVSIHSHMTTCSSLRLYKQHHYFVTIVMLKYYGSF